MFSEQTKEAILALQKKYPQKRSALIPALYLVQQEIGYLPMEAQEKVAELFAIDLNEVNGVVAFYSMFFDKPTGKHHIHVCKNVSCMLRGSDTLLENICRKLDISPGETTADGEFTVFASECLAACDLAPMILADDQVFGPVKEEDVEKILEATKKNPRHVSPIAEEKV